MPLLIYQVVFYLFGGNVKYILIVISLSFLMFGCGPIQSTLEINKAEVEIRMAYRVQAHKKAPYEFYKAKAYLFKAKDERAYSDFKEAAVFAKKAVELAKKAKLIAEKDQSGLLEENNLKLEKDALDTRDESVDIETINKVDKAKIENQKREIKQNDNDSDDLD